LLLVWTGFWPLPVGVMPYSTVNTPSEVFVVLDAPKAPMSPAWVSVLRLSCSWAQQSTTALRAAELLTLKIWLHCVYLQGVPDEIAQAFTRRHSETGETFYLRSFLRGTQRIPAFHGQCNDLADFLVCAVTSVGALPLRSQRTYRLDAAYFQNDADGGGWQLVTGVVDPAGAAPQNFALTVSYHQFAIYQDKVWDASYGFIKTDGSIVHSIGWSRDSYYKPVLVRRFVRWENHAPQQEVRPSDPENPWNPTPDNGFLPVITAEDLPEAN